MSEGERKRVEADKQERKGGKEGESERKRKMNGNMNDVFFEMGFWCG